MNYFSDDELRCKCGCGTLVFDEAFRKKLNEIRDDYAKPMIVTSGYRCPNHPNEVHKTRTGAHGLGCAVDIAVSYEDAYRLLETALRHGIKRVGINQKGDGRFIHLDSSTYHPSPTIWSY